MGHLVEDRRVDKREERRQEKTANDGQSERPLELFTATYSDGKRDHGKNRRRTGH